MTQHIFLIFEKVPKRHPRGMNFRPVIGGTPAHTVNIFSEQRFPVIRIKIDFPRNFEILFPGSGPRYSYQIFFPDEPFASPCNERKKLAPIPENLAKMGVKFFGGGAISITWGKIVGVV